MGISRGSCGVLSHNHPTWRGGFGRGENFEELVVASWETRRLLGRLASASLDLP